MAKSKVDTKALEEVNGTSAPQTSDNVGGTEIFKMAHDALELLVTCFGTNEQAAERLAGQFCSSTNFLLNGSEKFDGATRRALDAQANVVKFEEQVENNVAGSSTNTHTYTQSATTSVVVTDTINADTNGKIFFSLSNVGLYGAGLSWIRLRAQNYNSSGTFTGTSSLSLSSGTVDGTWLKIQIPCGTWQRELRKAYDKNTQINSQSLLLVMNIEIIWTKEHQAFLI